MTRDWTEAQARAWLRASLPKGWVVGARASGAGWANVAASFSHDIHMYRLAPTLRSACRALIRAAKRAGIAVNQVQEPGGKS